MDRYIRLAVILALIGISLFRLVRYFKHGLKGRPTAIPGSAGILLQESNPAPSVSTDSSINPSMASSVASPVASDTRAARITSGFITFLVWAAANVALWLILFGLPALAGIPAIWRLFVGVFANFYLFRFAHSLGERRKRAHAKAAERGNPFSG